MAPFVLCLIDQIMIVHNTLSKSLLNRQQNGYNFPNKF